MLRSVLCHSTCWLATLVGTYGIFCAAVSVGSQCVVARFARRHLWGICAAVSVGSHRVVARFARRHLTRICAVASVESQYMVARFARSHLKGICAAVNSVGVAQCVMARVLWR